ncbi:MAG: SDR family NAD(P)-dependent oxidoreductase, partial [Pseudomonadota bacterium]
MLNDKIALVTGGASGFGAGIARSFAEAGARVAVADIDLPGATAVAAEIDGVPVEADVSQRDSVLAMSEAIDRALGPLDILVNNAGITHRPTPLEDVEEEDFDRVLAVNAKSV